METENKFKNSPIHDKRLILEMMDKLEPKEMVKVVDFIQEQVKLFCQPNVIKSVCKHNWIETPEETKEIELYTCNKCGKQTVL